MKLIIAGSRSVSPTAEEITTAISDSLGVGAMLRITEVVSGTAKGADLAGEQWAASNGVQVSRFPADWERHGKLAGKRRNAQMADYADAAIVFWDGVSNGATDMVARMVYRGKPVAVVGKP